MSDQESHLRKLIETLETENAALRAALEAQAHYQRDLRADRDRLDWLEHSTLLWEGTDANGPEFITRAAIDAARKEAK